MQPTSPDKLLIGKRPVGTIGYISGKMVSEEFMWSLMQMQAMSYEYFLQPGTYLHIDHSTVSGQVIARNELVAKMQGDWLLQLDSDHTFEPDLLFKMMRLFEAQNLDVLTGLYCFREPPHNPVLYQYHDGQYKNIVDWGGDGEAQLLPIDAAGAGCLLVRRRVFDKIRAAHDCMPFCQFGKFTTDDFSFFERCRVLGIKSYCAVQVDFRHMGMSKYGIKDFDKRYAVPVILQTAQALA